MLPVNNVSLVPAGGPFKTLVDSVGGTGRVSAFGAGLTAARSGQTTEFTVLLHNADKSAFDN